LSYNGFDCVFEKITITDPWMDAKLNSMTHKKKVFQCFELFRARLAYKFAKTDFTCLLGV
jgi:hypothetical protein